MVQDIVIRAEFLIEDLKKSIFVKIENDENNARGDAYDFHPNIIKAWKEDIRYIIQNAIESENEQIYDFKNKEDLKECIYMCLDAEDIAYLVNQCRDDKDNTQFFTYCNTQQMYGLHILSKADVTKAISKQIEQIALNTLKYPYKDAYAELYREFVVPMIEGQGY